MPLIDSYIAYLAKFNASAIILESNKNLVVRLPSGDRSAAQQVRDRLTTIDDSPKDSAIAARAEKNLPKLDDLSLFSSRFGAEALALLQAREAELLELHKALAKQEGTGHLHAGS